MGGVARPRRATPVMGGRLRPAARELLGLAGAAVILAAVSLFLYGDCLRQFFDPDDLVFLRRVSGLEITSLAGLRVVFAPTYSFALYRPLSHGLYFLVLEKIFGYDPAGYHLVQLAVHVANATLVFALAARILRSRPAGLATALVYAAAPGHAMAVYWNNVFSMTGTALWYFAALYAWLALSGWRRQATGLVFLGLGLLTSEHAITLPVALTLMALLVAEPGGLRRVLREQWPLYALAVAYGAAKLWYMQAGIAAGIPNPVARVYFLRHYGLTFAPLTVVELLGYYLGTAVSWLDQLTGGRGPAQLLLGFAFLGAVVASAWWARRSRAGAAPLCGLILFAVALVPVLGLANRRAIYYAGIAAFGSSLALVSAARAVPRLGSVAMAAVAVAALWGRAVLPIHSPGPAFHRGQAVAAAGWLSAVDERVRAHPEVHEVFVPDNAITKLVFENTRAHELFYEAAYRVHVGGTAPPGRMPEAAAALSSAPRWDPRRQFPPGRSPRWDWIRCLRLWPSPRPEVCAAKPTHDQSSGTPRRP